MTPALPQAFNESEQGTTPERRLMLATIVNAIADATGYNNTGCNPSLRKLDRERALKWFENAGPDYVTVCHLAGLDPDCLRRAALEFIESGKRVPRKVGEISDLRSRAPSKPKPPRFGASIADIAKHAGVSRSAVENVLYGYGSTSRDMKDRVHRARRELAEAQKETA